MKINKDSNASGTPPAASKRARTRAQLLANAIALFRSRGVRATRLAEIARAADVVAATLYNHFPTKAAIVEAWLRGEIDEALAEAVGSEAVGHPLRPPLRRLCRALSVAAAAEPELRSEAWRVVGRARDPDDGLPAPLVAAVRAEQRAGHLRSDLAPERLAAMILDALEGGLVAGLAGLRAGGESGGAGEGDGEAVTDASEAREPARRLGAALQASVDLVLDGARKRNERVRPPRRST